jgi:hypothetical protein
MRARLVIAAGALALSARGVAAQDAQCTNQVKQAQDACQKAVDLFNFMAPQLGTSQAGGNATLGVGGVLGGLGHFSLGLRANVMQGTIPDFNGVNVDTSGIQQSDLGGKDQLLGLPTVEAAIGLYKGFPMGLSHIGGVDAIVSASYVPEVTGDQVDLRVPSGNLKLGYGARVGVLEEHGLVPAVSVTYLQRSLPTMNIVGKPNDDTLAVSGLDLKTTAWRIVASKHLLLLTLAAGFGQDKYSSKANLDVTVNEPGFRVQGTAITFNQDMTRTNMFLDAGLNLFVFKLIGEVGQVSGGSVSTYNSFGTKKADDSYLYGSIGLRFGW